MGSFKSFGILGAVFLCLYLISLGLFFDDSLGSVFRQFFAPPERQVLSVAVGQVMPGAIAQVVKIKTPSGIVIEIYKEAAPDADKNTFVDRILLNDAHDAYFQFKGRATNLALKDMNGDSVFEIIAPSFDSSLVPHLNIFRYNKDSSKFEPYLE